MKIVAISDTHNMHSKFTLPEGDLLIHAGDACGWGSREEFEDFVKWLGRQDFEHKIYVPGNHDLYVEQNPARCRRMLAHAGVHLLIDEGVVLGGLKIYGTPMTPTFGAWSFMADEEELRDYYDMIPEGMDVIVCHGPPRGLLDRNLEGDLCGSEALLEALLERQPQVFICGHIHEGRGSARLGRTDLYNVAAVTRHHGIVRGAGTVIEMGGEDEA